MKITAKIPDAVFRRANREISVAGLMEAPAHEIRAHREAAGGKPWVQAFGKLRRLRGLSF